MYTWIVVLGGLLCAVSAHAATIVANNCTQAEVQARVNQAVAGDIVELPTCNITTWAAGTEVLITKQITLRGAGVNNTRIKLGAHGGCNALMIEVNAPGDDVFIDGFVMEGISLEGSQGGIIQKYERGLQCHDCINFKIHNNAFKHLGVGAVIKGNALTVKGVIYNNTFNNINLPGGTGCSTHGYGVEVEGGGIWGVVDNTTLGTQQAVYIEDNTFDFVRHAVASNNGSRYVFRNNTITNSARHDAAPVDVHGFEGSGWAQGSRSYEVYNNTIQGNTTPGLGNNPAAVGIRGGDGVIYNNTVSDVVNAVRFNNSPTTTGCNCTYPCEDQTTDAYVYNNTPNTVSVVGNCVQTPRDYVLTARAGYTALQYPHPLRNTPPTLTPGMPLNARILQ